jgi:hypothetical protein
MWNRAKRAAPVIIGILFVGLAIVAVWPAPSWFVGGRDFESAAEQSKAENDVRTTLVQVLAGGVLAVGGYFTYQQLQTTREGQITERYTRAIDQLGHGELDVRLGGIYALERIARDSPDDRRTIAEVLTAFVRTHSPWPPSRPGQPDASAPVVEVPALQQRAPDVQASLTVLGRGAFGSFPDTTGLELNSIDLRKADLFRADLKRARFGHAHLRWANLKDANLEEADLDVANLQWARLSGARLERAYLNMTNLRSALLADANLKSARFGGADLTRADLTRANLERADLRGANFGRATLGEARLVGARADGRTKWPDGFDWQAAGVIIPSDE